MLQGKKNEWLKKNAVLSLVPVRGYYLRLISGEIRFFFKSSIQGLGIFLQCRIFKAKKYASCFFRKF